jgi:hypothetical protein
MMSLGILVSRFVLLLAKTLFGFVTALTLSQDRRPNLPNEETRACGLLSEILEEYEANQIHVTWDLESANMSVLMVGSVSASRNNPLL